MRGFKLGFMRGLKLSLEVCNVQLRSTDWEISISIEFAFFGAIVIDDGGGDSRVASDDDNPALRHDQNTNTTCPKRIPQLVVRQPKILPGNLCPCLYPDRVGSGINRIF